LLGAPAVIAFEQIGDTKHHFKGGVVVTVVRKGAAMQVIAQMEQIQFPEPVTLLQGGKGVVLLEGMPVGGGAGLLLLEQGSNQGQRSLDDEEQGKRCKALKGSDLIQRWRSHPCWRGAKPCTP
jgi:hypothetical protein